MAGIDGILTIVIEQDATELRLGTGRVPKLFRHGAPKRFLMPETSEETLRSLLGELLGEHEASLVEKGRASFRYGEFDVVLRQRYQGQGDDEDEDDDNKPVVGRVVVGFDVVFRREATGADDEDDDDAPEPAPPVHQPPSLPPPFAPGFAPHVQVPVAPPSAPTVRPRPSSELTDLLTRAVSMGASDLHLAEDEQPVFRVHGQLRGTSNEPSLIMEMVLDGCLVPSVLERLAHGASADFSFSIASVGRFRGNIYRSVGGLCAAFRVLPDRAPSLDALNLPNSLASLVTVSAGLVVVCGPTGSGKSATMAALVQRALDESPMLLITLEDPVEYRFRVGRSGGLVRQREVGIDVRDFQTGLRDALREDPDVLLVGEMRDAETISMALTAAETGHLVISSLHSRSASSAVERIIDSYPPERQAQIRVQLADSLQAVVSQRLVPSLGGSGRLPALEILRTTYGVASMIREGKTAQLASAIQSGGNDGMTSLEKTLAELVRQHRIDIRSARRVANDLETLNNYLHGR